MRGSPFSKRDRFNQLRQAVERAREELIAAEADLADQMAEIAAFERLVDLRLGSLRSELAALEEDIQHYRLQIDLVRGQNVFGLGHMPVEEQYRRAWQGPLEDLIAPARQDVGPSTEVDIKRLYRQLARRFHPDLASDAGEREWRTARMAALNEAYAARDLDRMQALARGRDVIAGQGISTDGRRAAGPTQPETLADLEQELARIQVRRSRIQQELDNLLRRPSVQLSVDVKLARRRGRDLLREMQADLAGQVAQRRAERDALLEQYQSLS